MDLVGALITALAEIAAAGDAKFPHHLVAQRLKLGAAGVHLRKIPHHRHDVDNRFGGKTGHRGGTDVVDGGQILPQNLTDGLSLLLIKSGPLRIVGDNDNVLTHLGFLLFDGEKKLPA